MRMCVYTHTRARARARTHTHTHTHTHTNMPKTELLTLFSLHSYLKPCLIPAHLST
jgi:hypothetical protein